MEPNWLTHFSRACEKLGIEIIKAYSPQAKGRVERNHAVYQDRFVKELKLRKITDIEKANELLSQSFVNRLNEKFAKPASDSSDAHVPLHPDNELNQMLCWEYTRKIGNDWTVRFESRYFQIEKTAPVRPKQTVTVRKHLDDSISLGANNVEIPFHEIPKPKPKLQKEKRGNDPVVCSRVARENKHKTPWGQFNPQWLKPRKRAKTNKANTKLG